jgi:EAL domain-containing protein (putative c-di-GMP-specific phosphodiesterase class I)
VRLDLSPSQLKSPRFLRTITALENSGLSASRLDLEISQRTLLNDGKSTLNTLRDVRGVGVRIALENFGAGYPSPSGLKSFPVDIIKIDSSLINPIAAENNFKEIFRAVTDGRAQSRRDHDSQGHRIGRAPQSCARCDEAQGYLICPPLPVEGADSRH